MPTRKEYFDSLRLCSLSGEEMVNLSKENVSDDIVTALDCPLCFESMASSSDIVSACEGSHLFHYDCLIECFSARNEGYAYRRHCPMCRRELFSDDKVRMPTPYEHSTEDDSDPLWWWTDIYRDIDNTRTDELVDPPEVLPITEIGAWWATQTAQDRRAVKSWGFTAGNNYFMLLFEEGVEEPSWMTIYERLASLEEANPIFRRYGTARYVAPTRPPPQWLPITEYGAWVAAITEEQRAEVERRAHTVKEAYERVLEG